MKTPTLIAALLAAFALAGPAAAAPYLSSSVICDDTCDGDGECGDHAAADPGETDSESQPLRRLVGAV